MTKFIILSTKIIVATIAAMLLTSCHANINWGNGIDGNGKVITQTRTVENNFSKIAVSRGLTVTLEQSSSYAVSVEADENLQKHITTYVENGTLIVTSDENIDDATAKTIHIKLPTLSAVEATSGSSIITKSTFSGSYMLAKSSSGSTADLSFEIDNIKCEATSGSTLNLKGKALKLNTSSSSGSTIDAKALLVNDVVAEATSGSSTQVHSGVSINAKASSGSSIDYSGNPKTVTKAESSGGSVSKE
jgi:hypothetical protein